MTIPRKLSATLGALALGAGCLAAAPVQAAAVPPDWCAFYRIDPNAILVIGTQRKPYKIYATGMDTRKGTLPRSQDDDSTYVRWVRAIPSSKTRIAKVAVYSNGGWFRCESQGWLS